MAGRFSDTAKPGKPGSTERKMSSLTWFHFRGQYNITAEQEPEDQQRSGVGTRAAFGMPRLLVSSGSTFQKAGPGRWPPRGTYSHHIFLSSTACFNRKDWSIPWMLCLRKKPSSYTA